jgi:hypothetical protein
MRKISARTVCTAGIAALGVLTACAAFAGLATRNGEARLAIPRYGNVFQSGALVGWASGVKISPLDGTVVEFEQITHARQLVHQDEFEYGGLKMRIAQVLQVDYTPEGKAGGRSAARPDTTLLRVTARLRRSD